MNAPAVPCPSCYEFFLRGHLEGQQHAKATDQQTAETAARIQLALELEADQNRRLAKSAGSFIDVTAAREKTKQANANRPDSRPAWMVAA